MAGSNGYPFILFTVVFYSFIGFLLFGLGAWATLSSELPGYIQPGCLPMLNNYTFIPAAQINTTDLQNLANGTLFKGDIFFGTANQTYGIHDKQNATWFTPVAYNSWKYGENVNVLYSIRYDTITYVGVPSTAINTDCQQLTGLNFLVVIWLLFTNPFTMLGFISWLTVCFLIVDIYIIFTDLIP